MVLLFGVHFHSYAIRRYSQNKPCFSNWRSLYCQKGSETQRAATRLSFWRGAESGAGVSGFIVATCQRVLPCSEESRNGSVAYDQPGTQFPQLDTPPRSDNEAAVSRVDDHRVLAEKPEKSRRPATAAPGILAPGNRSLTVSLEVNDWSVPPVARVHRASGWRG